MENGKLKMENYKQTELGLIPENWEVKKLGNEINILGGNAFSSNDISEEGIKWLKIANVGINKIKEDTLEFLPFEFKEIHKDFLLKSGDYVMALTRPLLGGKLKISKILNNDEWLLNQRVAKLDSKVGTIEYYINYFKQPYFCYQLEVLMAGTDPPNLSLTEFKNIKIPIPPLPEQKKIADCLSTWDVAINNLQLIIENLQLRKKALMQQLLTGKKRLPGFEGKWKEVKLGSLGKTYNGLTGKTKEDFGEGKPFITYMNIFSNPKINISNFEYVKMGVNENQNKAIYGDIFFTVSSETPNEVGMASVLLDKVDDLYLNSFCFGFRLNDFKNLLPEFSSYLFRNDLFRKEVYKLAQGSTRFNLSKLELMKIKIKLPTLSEQTAIAEILATADRELTLQKEKLAQLQLQKKGLMQVLLTGKKRLMN